MRKTDEHGVSYSVVPFGTSRQLFLAAEPQENYLCSNDDTQGHGQTTPDWPRQVRNLLESCQAALRREGFDHNAVVMSNFFLADIGKKELVRQLASEFFPENLGAVTLIPQSPASGCAVSVEIWAISNIVCDVSLSGPTTVAEFDEMRWFFGGDIRSDHLPIGAYSRSLDAFQQLGKKLKQNRFGVGQLVRTWIYQGHLVLPEGNTQRYKELNRARTDFFSGVEFIKDYLPPGHKGGRYPASTGIGADDVDVVIGAVAVLTNRKDFIAVPLENPNQTSAFDYGTAYSPQSPKFSRAMAIAVKDSCLIFVSGTASITDSESRFPEDPIKQTEQTLDNIAALISGENLDRHRVHGFESSLDHLECVRVYVKRPDEFEAIRRVCEKRLGHIPILYTIADVCRPELLVEIEGFAVVNRYEKK